MYLYLDVFLFKNLGLFSDFILWLLWLIVVFLQISMFEKHINYFFIYIFFIFDKKKCLRNKK